METSEVPEEMCVQLSQAAGLWAAAGSVVEYRRVWTQRGLSRLLGT